jgi:hypothetical protein
VGNFRPPLLEKFHLTLTRWLGWLILPQSARHLATRAIPPSDLELGALCHTGRSVTAAECGMNVRQLFLSTCTHGGTFCL